MGRGKALTDYERGQIHALRDEGNSARAIEAAIGRSRSAVDHYLADPLNYNQPYGGGRPAKLTDRDKRRIFREAAPGNVSPKKIVDKLHLEVSKATVIRTLNSSDIFEYTKMNKAPKLTEKHKMARVAWAEIYVRTSDDMWVRNFFSDEKKWNLDGPDGLKYYWHCLRNDPSVAFSRQNGGGTLMVWGAFFADGRAELAFLDGNQNADDYIHTLSEYLLPVTFGHFGCEAIFQQDNASIHTAARTKAFFDEVALDVMDWPALSPDLNPIENVLGYLSQVVYGDGKQYETKDQLKTAIQRAWSAMDQNYLRHLVQGMPGRCTSVLKAHGEHINK